MPCKLEPWTSWRKKKIFEKRPSKHLHLASLNTKSFPCLNNKNTKPLRNFAPGTRSRFTCLSSVISRKTVRYLGLTWDSHSSLHVTINPGCASNFKKGGCTPSAFTGEYPGICAGMTWILDSFLVQTRQSKLQILQTKPASLQGTCSISKFWKSFTWHPPRNTTHLYKNRLMISWPSNQSASEFHQPAIHQWWFVNFEPWHQGDLLLQQGELPTNTSTRSMGEGHESKLVWQAMPRSWVCIEENLMDTWILLLTRCNFDQMHDQQVSSKFHKQLDTATTALRQPTNNLFRLVVQFTKSSLTSYLWSSMAPFNTERSMCQISPNLFLPRCSQRPGLNSSTSFPQSSAPSRLERLKHQELSAKPAVT